ncbi:RagB/SusD family nutrient uptake outer membrane protein [Chitinophaga caseinilytica]|uniref:RagB/SusD family nutrient uptake outer membrane protein n=1 Tax=Chitinophaga caseinilytica TaxID=2267521 RepID=A0ABZ2Z585_9BACT
MKKRHAYIAILTAASFTAASCGKNFLDEEPSTSVSVGNAIISEGSMLEAMNGAYRNMTGSLYFGRNVPLFGDLLADNVYLSSSNSGRLIPMNNYTFVGSSAEAANIWSSAYYVIQQANRVIYADLAATNNVNHMLGEAYALRALNYFYLVNLFAKPYAENPEADGVPVVILPTSVGGSLIKPARNKVKEVYAQIVSDLDKAFDLMPATGMNVHPYNTNFLSKYAAKALQARAYLYMGEYAKARDAAKKVVDEGGYSLAATEAAFTAFWASNAARTDKQETLFELNNNATANAGVEGLDAIYSSKSLGDMLATDELYDLYSATDRRRSLIVDGARSTQTVHYVNKYQNVTNTDRDEIKLLRYAEVLLILAESEARLNNNTEGQKYLNMVAQNRDPDQVAYTLTGAALVNAVIVERRKELAFEGLRLFDLYRQNATFNRPDMGAKAHSAYVEVKTTDFRRVQPIPETELAANPNMAKNPGY